MSTFAHSLLGVLPAWRFARRLPLWHFLPRRAHVQRLQALRCESCRLQPACMKRVAAGAFRPPSGCPNAELFG